MITVRRIEALPYALAFAHPVVTARGRFTHRRGWLVAVDDAEGRRGWGDAAPWPGFASTDERVSEAVGRITADDLSLLGHNVDPLRPLALRGLVAALALPPEVAHAVELALLDLIGQARGLPIARLVDAPEAPFDDGDGLASEVACHALVSDRADRAARVLKLKVGARDLDDDEARLAHLRASAPAQTLLRLDAGGAYDPATAREAMRRFARYDVALIEQPIAVGQLDALAELTAFGASLGMRVAADEELASGAPIDHVLATVDAVILKPMFLGGLLTARDYASRARDAGIEVVITNALESAVGRAGAIHLAASIAGVHGLDTALARDVGACPRREGAWIRRPNGSGLGVAPDETFVAQQGASPLPPGRVTAVSATPNPLSAAAAARPHHPALITDEVVFSYRALADEAARRASALAGEGVVAGMRVGLIGPRDAEWACWFHAIDWLGAEIAPLDDSAPDEEHRAALEALGTDAVIDASHRRLHLGGRSARRRAHPWAPGETRLAVTSSGSTGTPRVVTLTTEQLVLSAFGSATRLGHLPEDCWLGCLPLHHVGGLSILIRCVLYATTVRLHPRFDAERVARALDGGEATLVSLVPAMLERVLDAREPVPFPSTLRAILLGGAATSPSLRRRARALSAPVALTWGMTEAASQVATSYPGAFDSGDAVGPPLPFVEVDAEGPRLRLRGPLVGGELETGDAGYVDDAGYVHVTGRADAQIISGGENIDPEQIEGVLARHPAVAAAAVVGLPDAVWGARPHAALVLTSDEPRPSDAELAGHVRDHLARFKIPDSFTWLESLPTTSLGKVARARLRRRLARTQAAPSHQGHPRPTPHRRSNPGRTVTS